MPVFDRRTTTTAISEVHAVRLTPRGRRVAASLGLAAAVAVTGGTKAVVEHAADSVQQVRESARYSQPHLYETLQQSGELDPNALATATAELNDNPTTIARRLGAANVALVADEIAGQAGGESYVQPGEVFVIPKDQLNLPGN